MANGSRSAELGGAMFDLSGKVGVVTGAASGLGHAIAAGLARHGAYIVAADINEAGLEVTRERIVAAGGRAISVVCDVADEAAVARMFQAADDAYDRVDILVNDAFLPVARSRPESFTLEDWQRAIAVNLTGYFLCAREAGRRMIDQGSGGSIVNISSIAGSTGMGRGNFVYSVTKHGVNGLTRELAVEWAPHGIRVNAIQPCQFLTPGVQAWLDATPDSKSVIETFVRGIPLDRMGDPERDIVGPVVFLASDASSMVTGTMLPVDGGNLAFNAGGSKAW